MNSYSPPRCARCGCPVSIGTLPYPDVPVCAPQLIIGLLCRRCHRHD